MVKTYEGPVVLPHNFREACALVESLKSDYQAKSDGCFAALAHLDAESEAFSILKDIRDEARDKWTRFAKVLDRLRP